MKKITIDNINLTIAIDRCNFCGENKKECTKSAFPSTGCYVRYDRKLEWLKRSMFSLQELFWTTEDDFEVEHIKLYSFICSDCIKQIERLIK